MFGTGNKWDKWHGIFAMLIIILLTFIIYLFFGKSQMAFTVGFIISTLLIFALQGVNEALQLQSKKEVEKHGGYEAFAKNSKRDWAFAIMGWIFGSIVLVLIIGIFT